MDTFSDKNEEKGGDKFYCDFCYYKCSSKYNFSRHLLTDKHKKIHSEKMSDQTKKYKCH